MTGLLKKTALILRNDLRLLWREVRVGKLKAFTSSFVVLLVLLLLHVVSVLAFLQLRRPPPLSLEAGLWAFFGFWMLGTAMNQAIGIFFERADFDLLLSSPVPPRAVLLARIAVMSVGAFAGAGILLMPLLDGIMLGFSRAYLSGYAVWLALSVIAACAGVFLTLALVRLLGPRRARIWVQVFAAILGAAVYLSFQLQNHLAPGDKLAFWSVLRNAANASGFSHLASAGRGNPVDLAAVGAVAAIIAALTARQLAKTFLTGLQEANTRPTRAPRKNSRPYRFSGGLARATFSKDIRLIVRDPLLLSQILPSFMYILPAFLGFRRLGGMTVLAPIAVVIAVQFSSLLAEVAAAGEECLDLIRASPSPETRLRLAKMAAGMALPLVVCLVICMIIAGSGRPWIALITFATSSASAAACAWLSVAQVAPTPRKDLMNRGRRRTSVVRSIAIGAILLVACGGVSLVAHATLWFIGLILLGVTGLAVIACFTFVGIEEIDETAGTPSWPRPNATTS